MSVKEFFAFPNIKQTVIEFLRAKADFDSLSIKHKKPFRAHINKHQTTTAVNNLTAEMESISAAVSGTTSVVQNNLNNREYADYFVSDGFNSIKCHFSEVCKENFERMYPLSIKIFHTVNMLICI